MIVKRQMDSWWKYLVCFSKIMRVETGDCIRWQVVGTRAQSRLWSTLTPLRSREASVNRSTTDS